MTGRIARAFGAHEHAPRRQAGVLGAVILLTLGGGVWTAIVRVDHGSGPDTLTRVLNTTLTTGGQSRLAVEGDHLAAGDVLVTAATGHATLDVPDGALVLGPSTAVRVIGPRLAELLHGTAGLQLRHGSTALSLQTGTVTASVSTAGAGVRVGRDYRVTAAALTGPVELTGVDGARLDLPVLAEADVPGIVLPATSVPVQSLDHDAAGVDAVLAPDLVQLDVALDRLAAQVDADTVARAALRPASYESSLPAAATHPSEVALTRAIGTASGDAVVAGRRAVALRAAGAAWGVVAAALGVDANRLRSIIDAMLAEPTLRALVPVVATETTAPSGGAPIAAEPATAPSASQGSGQPTPPAPQPVSTTTPPHPGSPAPSTAPPSAAPPSNPITDLVDTVTGLLGVRPSPPPGPSPSPGPVGDLVCPIVGLLGLC